MTPPSFSVAVRDRPCLLTLKNRSRLSSEETSSHLQVAVQDQRLGAEQDQLPSGSTGTSSGNCQETESCMVSACHTLRQPLPKTILQGTLESGRRRGRQRNCWMDNIKEWTSLPMLELLTRASCRKDWKSSSAESSLMSPPPPDDPIGQGTELFESFYYMGV